MFIAFLLKQIVLHPRWWWVARCAQFWSWAAQSRLDVRLRLQSCGGCRHRNACRRYQHVCRNRRRWFFPDSFCNAGISRRFRRWFLHTKGTFLLANHGRSACSGVHRLWSIRYRKGNFSSNMDHLTGNILNSSSILAPICVAVPVGSSRAYWIALLLLW